MKKIFGLLAVFALAGLFALPVAAKSIDETNGPLSQAQGQCTDENKLAWYKEFTDLRTKDAVKAYEAAKKYLACSPTDDQYTAYLKKWSAAYDKEARKVKLPDLIYNQKKFAEAFTLGKEILADEPENVRVLMDLGYGGYVAAATTKNESFNADSINFAKKAIQLIEAGKAPDNWAPFKSKDDALAYLYYTLGYLNRTSPANALAPFIKAAQFESDLKKDPWTYYFIAAAYEAGPYAKLSADYKACCEGKDETPQSKLALENINQVIDRMVDAYARAVAFAGADAKYATAKKEWMESLTTWYKFRHNQSDAGMTEFVAGIMSKPLPPEPTPITSLPASTPASTPASGNNSGATPAGNGNSMTTQPASNAPAATTKSTTATKSSSTSAPGKPRNNHRRRR